MSSIRTSSRRVWATSQKGVYAVNVDHLSATELAEYRDFLTTIYEARVTLQSQLAGGETWLTIQPMRMSEIGLRVAYHYFGVPYSRSPYLR